MLRRENSYEKKLCLNTCVISFHFRSMAAYVRKSIFDIPFMQRKYHVSRPAAKIYKPDYPQDEQKYKPYGVFTHLSPCCVHNLIDFPQCLANAEVHTFCTSEPGTYYPSFCTNCHLPKASKELFKILNVDYMHKLQNWLKSEANWTESENDCDTSFHINYADMLVWGMSKYVVTTVMS